MQRCNCRDDVHAGCLGQRIVPAYQKGAPATLGKGSMAGEESDEDQDEEEEDDDDDEEEEEEEEEHDQEGENK